MATRWRLDVAARRGAALLLAAALLLIAIVPGTASADGTLAPARPTGLTSIAAHDLVTLSWDGSSDESITHYIILRRETDRHAPGHFITINENTGSAQTSYRDATVSAETRYVYRIKAVNAHGASPQSGYTDADTPAAPVSAPTLVTQPIDQSEQGASVEPLQSARATTCGGNQDPPEPTDVSVTAAPIVVASTTADYFVLYVSHDVDGTTIESPVLVKRGEAGTTTLEENIEALAQERYRVEQYQIADPADIDGDCIDDITELASPTAMNPLHPAASIARSDGVLAIPDHETFKTLAFEAHDGTLSVNFFVSGMDGDRPRLHFANMNTHPTHLSFRAAAGLEHPLPGIRDIGEMLFQPRLPAPDGSQGVYYFRLDWPLHPFSFLHRTYTTLAASMPMVTDNLSYFISDADLLDHQWVTDQLNNSRIHVLVPNDIHGLADFAPMNLGEGYGLLRVMEPDGRANPRDVVLFESLPNDLSKVAGIITTVQQTPLAHVNLRAMQDDVPNAYIRDALENDEISALIGNYVYYEVTKLGWTLRAASRAEVDAHYDAARPAHPQTPRRDLAVTAITPLSEIEFDDWTAFGVKATNVAVLGSIGLPSGTAPDGFAIPFYFYDEFMRHNGFYSRIRTMLADAEFQNDYAVQAKKLKKLRKDIEDAETPEWIVAALVEMNQSFPEGINRRYRSSTNTEDLPGFNGAGLYDSKSQKPSEDEKDLAKSLKEVYASMWNFRAFVERDFHRIDHLVAAMGILIHPSYQNELVNGVAVSFDPLYGFDDAYYINSQLGEDLVTNPEAQSVAEEILTAKSCCWTIVAFTSNQVDPGVLLMHEDRLDALVPQLTVIHDEFETLYDPADDQEFAMEIEFKFTSDDVLAIKQARPWVFGDRPANDPPAFADTTVAQRAVAETAAPGTILGAPFVATDPEHRSGIYWSLSGEDSDWFQIDGSTGQLQVRDALDFETRSVHNFKIVASDSLGASASRAIAVVVSDAAEPPVFPPGAATRLVLENKPAGTDVGDPVAADDHDAGDQVTHTLSGADEDSFMINAASGQLQTVAPLVKETKDTYTVVVTARDLTGRSSSVVVTISVVTEVLIVPPKERVISVTSSAASGGGGGGGGGGPPPVPIPSEKDFEWNVTRDIEALDRDNDTPTGLWSDGAGLWVLENAESGPDAIFAYEIESGERLPEEGLTLDARNRFSHGLWSDGVTVLVADSGQDRLFAYNLESGERLEERELELHEANRDPRGVWSDGETVYVLDSVQDQLFSYLLSSGELLSRYPLDKLNRSPRGIWSDGVTLWVSDDGAKRLFAYRLEGESLTRREGEEFGFKPLLKAGNGNPRGIWSDGGVIFVVDEQDDRVYTYNMPDAIDARLSELTLSGIEYGEFSPVRIGYRALVGYDLTETTVTAKPTHSGATVSIRPADVDDTPDSGHQLSVGDGGEVTITVRSEDGSRTRVYRVALARCLAGLTGERLSLVSYTGGSVDELVTCARGLGVSAVYHYDEEGWAGLFLGAPAFLNQLFYNRFANGLPAPESLVAKREPGPGPGTTPNDAN